MAKLWDKGYSIDSFMEEFTVGNDYLLDQNLIKADCIASIAHARTLHKALILSAEELSVIESALRAVIDLDSQNLFTITIQDEDCHTAIESFITKRHGDVGKKIHTGRSRNDQVQTALRLWMREFSAVMACESAALAERLFKFAKTYEMVPMPGRTHMQLAMPSSVGLWAAAYAEELNDLVRHVLSINELLDQSPLGSAASYGTPLPLDRQFSAKQMGFSKVQNNVLYANNSRGKFEALLLDGCDYIGLTLSKLAQDLMFFTLDELGYFTLPKQLCTGSSIMPQKRNPDGLELTRSRSAVVSSCSQRIKSIIRSLPSGYNRDFQDTKEPLFTGAKTALQIVRIMDLMVSNLTVNQERLLQGCRKEIYATDEVLKRLSSGGSFRDLYKSVGTDLESISAYDPVETIRSRTSSGTTGNLGLADQSDAAAKLKRESLRLLNQYVSAYRKLTEMDLALVVW